MRCFALGVGIKKIGDRKKFYENAHNTHIHKAAVFFTLVLRRRIVDIYLQYKLK